MIAIPITSGRIARPTTLRLTLEPCPTVPGGQTGGEMARYRRQLRSLAPGSDVFILATRYQYPYKAAAQIGAKVRVRKSEAGGWQVWRLA